MYNTQNAFQKYSTVALALLETVVDIEQSAGDELDTADYKRIAFHHAQQLIADGL